MPITTDAKTDSFKEVFLMILKEAEEKVKDSGYDPSSSVGKALISALYKKILLEMDIDLGKYQNEEMKMFLEENRSSLKSEVGIDVESIMRSIQEVGKRPLRWADISDKPDILDPEDYRFGYQKMMDAFSKKINFIKDELLRAISGQIQKITISHDRIRGIGPDDHHAEKHTLESHLDSPLMDRLREISNPGPAPRRYVQRRSFTQLNDAPATYKDKAGKVVAVKTDETGLEFITASTGSIADNETPSGTINGSNTIFTLANTPSPTGSLQVFLNGAYQTPGGEDYTLSGVTITFVNAPLSGSILRVFYRY